MASGPARSIPLALGNITCHSFQLSNELRANFMFVSRSQWLLQEIYVMLRFLHVYSYVVCFAIVTVAQ
jgi:hypothetical protein